MNVNTRSLYRNLNFLVRFKLVYLVFFSSMFAVSANAQDCNLNIIHTQPESRYKVMSNGTEVKDKDTNLIWQRCSVGQTWDGKTCSGSASPYNFQQALAETQKLGNGYRLPNIKELQSLTERACYNPAINSSIFPNTPSERYWSASPIASTKYAEWGWGVEFKEGDTVTTRLTYFMQYARAVRDSQ